MQTPLTPALLFTVFLLAAGCASPASRIARNQAAFDSWPAVVRERVRAGQAGLGFTMEQVRVALGEPDRKFTRITASGTSEVWAYRELGPDVSFGLGMGVGAGGPMAAGGGVSLEDYRYGESVRVVFEHDLVSAIETRRR
jgi:hypothetical protein